MPIKFSVKKQLLLLVGLSILVIVVIIKPWQLYFLNDDFMHIPDARVWLRSGFMRPVSNVFLWIDKQLYGNKPLGFFMTAMCFHVGAVIMVFFTTIKISKQYLAALPHELFPFCTAFFFLVYPWHAEPLMWLISRGSMLATLFTVSSFYFYIGTKNRHYNILISALLFILALFSYESIWNAILFFGLFSFLNVRFKFSTIRTEAKYFGMMVFIFIGYLILRVQLLHTLAGDGYVEINENLKHVPLLFGNWLKLFARVFSPPFENSNYFIFCFSVIIIVVVWGLYFAIKKNRILFLFMLLAVFGIASSVVTAAPLGIDTHYNEGERYLYFASFFYCLLLAFVCCYLLPNKYFKTVVILIGIGFIVALYQLQHNYKFASQVAKTTLKKVRNYRELNRVVFVDVPTQFKGSLIFRICLPNAIAWINPECKYERIEVQSSARVIDAVANYAEGDVSWGEFAAAKQLQINDLKLPMSILSDTITKNDAIFWFKSTGIYKVKIHDP